MMELHITEGDAPLILGQPHGGTDVPDAIASRLNERGLELADTDWHIGRLYDGLLPGASVVRTPIHRYVIDANRDPSGVSLYPGQNTTSLCPITDFDGYSIYRDGQEPDAAEIEERRALYHAPYHAALAEQITRVTAKHGFAVLYDCHSIRSQIRFLFDGVLPAFNVGTNNGTTCAKVIEEAVFEQCVQTGNDAVLNGRFKGGWTTRHYGDPDNSVHAVQMELAQYTYMLEEPPWTYRDDRPHYAPGLQHMLKSILGVLVASATDYEERRGNSNV